LPSEGGKDKFGDSRSLITIFRIVTKTVAGVYIDGERTPQLKVHIIPMLFNVTVWIAFLLVFLYLIRP
jgi:hypothetical protein